VNISKIKSLINDDKIIYGFHYYLPHQYTHQGIKGWSELYEYPGFINNKYWNKEEIRNEIELASNWAKENNQLLYVGEFSVVRWANGKDEYLEDVLNIFEEKNIGYTYWILNEWNGWNMDFEQSGQKTNSLIRYNGKTRTREILESFWMKNNYN
jgi:hypothetical protein